MEIGILTFYSSKDNYGQILQLFALQQVLKSMGHNPELIMIPEFPEPDKITPYRLFKRIIKSVIRSFRRSKTNEQALYISADRKFNEFKSEMIKINPKIYDYSDLKISPPLKECYIVGSDQVWSLGAKQYFLDWVKNNGIKISYAASFGGYRLPKKNKKFYHEALSQFTNISVREKDGIRFCKQVGIDQVEVVLDPTLLLNKSQYELLIPERPQEQPYIVIYLIGWNTNIDISKIYNWAKTKGYEVRYVASQGRSDKYEKVFPTIPDWLGLIRDAEYVITNSFHGTVFSIIMQKKFLAIPLSADAEPMNNRLKELLYPLELDKRLYSGNFENIENEIDYKLVNKLLTKRIDKSYEWLQKALTNSDLRINNN